MYCARCGAELPEVGNFCMNCGANVSAQRAEAMRAEVTQVKDNGLRTEAEQSGNAEGSETDSRTKDTWQRKTRQLASKAEDAAPGNGETSGKLPGNRVILIAVCAAAALTIGVLVIILLMGSSGAVINLNDYISISVAGYDSVGTATVTFDTESFIADYEEKLTESVEKSFGRGGLLGRNSESDDIRSDYDAIMLLEYAVNYSLDRTEGLSNGDVITLTWNCDDEYVEDNCDYTLKYSDVSYTISELQATEVFDPFQGVAVDFDGIAPDGNAHMNIEDDELIIDELCYSLDITSGLTNGDTVTVTVSTFEGEDLKQYCMINYGLMPETSEQTYTVEGLSTYISSLDEISEAALSEMKGQAQDVYAASIAQNWAETETLISMDYLGIYFLNGKDSFESLSIRNVLYLVYRIQVRDVYTRNEETYDEVNTVYWFLKFSNLTVNSDGTTDVDLSTYSTPGNKVSFDSGLKYSWNYNGYTSLDELYRTVVIGNLEFYTYEQAIDENSQSDAVEETASSALDNPEGSTEQEAAEGLIFPNSSEELITQSEAEALSDEELRYAINEIYARNGYIFRDETLLEYYRQFDWYQETVLPDDFTTSIFNDIEWENVQLLSAERDSR